MSEHLEKILASERVGASSLRIACDRAVTGNHSHPPRRGVTFEKRGNVLVGTSTMSSTLDHHAPDSTVAQSAAHLGNTIANEPDRVEREATPRNQRRKLVDLSDGKFRWQHASDVQHVVCVDNERHQRSIRPRRPANTPKVMDRPESKRCRTVGSRISARSSSACPLLASACPLLASACRVPVLCWPRK